MSYELSTGLFFWFVWRGTGRLSTLTTFAALSELALIMASARSYTLPTFKNM